MNPRKTQAMNTTQRLWNRRRLIGATASAAIGAALLPLAVQAAGFDHSHRAWDALLKKNVAVIGDGHASKVDYAAFKNQRAALGDYLKTLSAVTRADYDGWSKPQRLAFLINAYNAFTVELILTRYPDLKSIKDLGSVFQSPWQKKFFTLLGAERSLDEVEHDTIRAPGAFDDPRIHFAVNCASVGCPMLMRDAYVADRLDAQLDDATRRFLSDPTRKPLSAAVGHAGGLEAVRLVCEGFRAGPPGHRLAQSLFCKPCEGACRHRGGSGGDTRRPLAARFPRLRLDAQRQGLTQERRTAL